MDNMKNTLLYLMHVDWGWAKQRPHFIAEGLAENFQVCVRFNFSYRRNLINAAPIQASLRAGAIWRLPFVRFTIVAQLNRWLARAQLALRARTSKVIWVTHPSMYDLVEWCINPHATVVYDCMDDALEFPRALSNTRQSEEIAALEARLILRANVVFSSSQYLSSKLKARYGECINVHVVNNGARSALCQTSHHNEPQRSITELLGPAVNAPGKRILYVGTISEWFNFDLILRNLKTVGEVSYVLVGPCEINPPAHERLYVLPPVKHMEVAKLMAWADALVMPFHVTELIRSVNPVKVYEYIEADKPAIVVRYGETEIFEPYVYLYKNYTEYEELISKITRNELQVKVQAEVSKTFVKKNTWQSRIDSMLGILRG